MRESEVERQFVEAVRAAGGQALKFTSQSMNGVPCQMINCFCMYSDYTPLTLEEWVECAQRRRKIFISEK